jgi:hypothetical protein
MWGQTYFGGLIKGQQTTTSGGLAKLGWVQYVAIYITAVFVLLKPLIAPTYRYF